MRIPVLLAAVLILFPLAAVAQVLVYPVPWPKAGGGMLVAVPLGDAKITANRRVAKPHGTGWNSPFPFTRPAPVAQKAGEPLILFAPGVGSLPTDDEDDFFLLFSDVPLVLSIADDERSQPGSPDRLYFMPATSGTFRGRTFYAGANGGDPDLRLRVFNATALAATATISAWNGTSWALQGTVQVPASGDAVFDPSVAQAAYKVETTQDALVLVGYVVDNATAPAADAVSGETVGEELIGFGQAWHLRAVQALSYVVETRAPGAAAWTQAATGTLLADASAGARLPLADQWVRLRLTGGRGWGIVGAPSLLANTEWSGYFLPTQQPNACIVGAKFFTNGLARTISTLPNPGTTVKIYDEATSQLLDTYTSKGAWEFHNFFHTAKVRVEFSNGSGAVLLVGTLNWGGCDEATVPGSCGILEGGYSLPSVSAFQCVGDGILGNCNVTLGNACVQPPAASDGGTADAAAGEDAAAIGTDSGAGRLDAAQAGLDAAGAGPDAATEEDAGTGAARDSGTVRGSDAGKAAAPASGCGCSSGGEPALLALLAIPVATLRRRRR